MTFAAGNYGSGGDSVIRGLLGGIIVEFWNDAGWTDMCCTAMTNETGELTVTLTPGTYYVPLSRRFRRLLPEHDSGESGLRGPG